MKPAHLSLTSLLGAFALSLLLVACGGGGGGGGDSGSSGSSGGSSSSSSSSASSISVGSYSSAANTAILTVDNTYSSINPLYVSVKLCVPGSTTNCKTVDHVLVDTGSTGLRIMASALDSTFINALGARTTNSVAVQECMTFASGHTWGAVKLADFTIGEKSVSGLALQVINDGSYTEPSLCSNTGTSYNTTAMLGANGILGIGTALQDCGTQCETIANNSVYMSCSTSSSTSCAWVVLDSADQLLNPVSEFSSDNNGVVISLPAISTATGANTVTGTLIFGIDTRSNNQSSAVTVYGTDSAGWLSQATYGSTTYDTIIDSGSNGYFFPDSSITRCSSSWYCPTTTKSLTATIQSVTTAISSKTATISFSLGNASSLFNTGRSAFNDVGAYSSGYFIFGLPFFYGRTVYVAFDGSTTSAGAGPYTGF